MKAWNLWSFNLTESAWSGTGVSPVFLTGETPVPLYRMQTLYKGWSALHIPPLTMWLNIFIPILLTILVIVCVLLTLIVLMQRPRSEGLGAAFGSGVTENIFGAQTATVLTKATVYLGCTFFVVTLVLTMLTARRSMNQRAGVLENEVRKAVTASTPQPLVSPSTPATPHASTTAAASVSPSVSTHPGASATPAASAVPSASASASSAASPTPIGSVSPSHPAGAQSSPAPGK
ncbi:MAG TPA: preprotein translocase subunit SecG [Chthoniobacterales bacterium]|nr:preprotein translocase subunit SecG [Chthoniobacterales bacterium]